MHFKKALSVFLAALMLFSVMSLGLTGVAAEIDYAAQYEMLADALKNEHVRELTNYKVVNATLKDANDQNEGFNQEAKGFAYDHTVFAQDNHTSDILRASNRFYYIAESLMSYQYGVGCYDAATLVAYITDKIKPYFLAEDGGVLYEDFFGNRYEPTEEEIARYNEVVKMLEEQGLEIDKINLPANGISFIEKDYWDYYNVETILRYFMGNSISVNAGNYYHRFSFVVQTSVNVFLEDCNGIDYIPYDEIKIRTGAYQFAYNKFYNETTSKAYYAFAEPSLQRVWDSYGAEYDFSLTPEDLSQTYNGVTRGGQASAYLIKTSEDKTTVPLLKQAYSQFMYFLEQQYTNNDKVRWDEIFCEMTDDEIDDPRNVVIKMGLNPDASTVARVKGYIQNVRNYGKEIFSDKYSNDALAALFGNDLGNMVTLHYLLKKTSEDPTRVVRGDATYTATGDAVTNILQDIDALISPRDGATGNDALIAGRVATVLKQFLDIGALLGTETEFEYETLSDLISNVLAELVFTDSIVNMLVELLYPMIVGLVVDNIGSIEIVGALLQEIVDDVIDGNGLAIYPNKLGDLLNTRYGSKYSTAAQLLKNAGDNWENVNFEAMTWGVDAVPTEQKADAFLDALCAGLCGFTNLLVCFLCGSEEVLSEAANNGYKRSDIESARQKIEPANFGKLYDIKVLGGLAWIHSQGLYTKLFIPLYRVLGIPEKFYMTTYEFEMALTYNTNDCLRNAVEPIILWVMECVAKKPIQTVMTLLPNLTHFLSRKGTVSLDDYKDKWAKPNFATDQEASHQGFATLQTYSLYDILQYVNLSITVVGANAYTTSIGDLIGDGTLGMLKSLNGLLNEVISFSYETDQLKGYAVLAYTNDSGKIVFPDSEEYGLDPGAYPYEVREYYSDEENTIFSLTETDVCTVHHIEPIYHEEPFYIPAIPEGKLISVGPKTAYNTIDVKEPGKVFVFLLRYVLSAVGYKYNINDPTLPSVIECLGLDLSGELFLGLGLGDIVNNVMIHPDAAICALLELFYSGETGDLYKKDPYTYPLEPIDYHASTLLNKAINPTLTYGSEVRYSQYWTKENADDFIANLTPLLEDVLMMIGLEGFEGGLGDFLENLINENLFTNDLVNTLFNTIYQLIAGLKDSIGIDIEGILDAVLDVSFAPSKIADTLEAMVGVTPASVAIRNVSSWAEMFPAVPETDPETGETSMVVQDVELDWGVTDTSVIENPSEANLTSGKVFLKSLASLFSPASFLIRFLFMDQDLSILGLINLPGYAGYHYAFIALLEALSCPSTSIKTYREYYELAQDPVCGDANTIYYLFSPILGLLEKAYADPLNVILSLIPNLLFFISIGGFNGLVNNLIHFAYVLLDILKPIINGYDLVSGLLANLDIAGLTLQLSLPLDIDFNALVSDLLGSLLGDTLTIEGVSIRIPYIDLYTLCVGTLESFNTKQIGVDSVFLNAVGGGDLLTAILRVVLEVLYMPENHVALSQIIANLAEEGRLDAYDEETLYLVLHGLLGLVEEYEVIDIVLFAVYKLITVLVPIADTLAERLSANDMTITELIDSAGDTDVFIANLGKLLEDPNEVPAPGHTEDGDAIMSLFDRIKLFFEKIKLFFQSLFNFG